MEKSQNRLGWIKKDNQDMLKWAIRYLNNHRASIPEQITYDGLIRESEKWPEGSETRELLKKMKGAWRQKKLRESLNGKKPSNFILSTSAKKCLENLAKSRRSNITETLEWLIKNGVEIKNQYRDQLDELNKSHRKQLDDYQIAAVTLTEKLSESLTETCKLTLQIEALTPTPKSLPTPQKDQIEDLFRKKKSTLLKSSSIIKRDAIRIHERQIQPTIHYLEQELEQ
ncbi:TPA: hypothetical protein ACRL78_004514 [Pseudomonas aeruginosa]|nr:hypothetical protein [Pseudomonas aeruginosa]